MISTASSTNTNTSTRTAKSRKPAATPATTAADAAANPRKSGGARASRSTASTSTSATGSKDSSLIFGIKPYNERKSETYMSRRQREHFRAILLAWRKQLYGEVSRTVHNMQDETINLPDPADRASQETDITMELRNRDRERKLLRKIAASVEQLDTDDYGYCEKCGVEIGIRRLEARPTATLCVDCKSLDEIRERQMA